MDPLDNWVWGALTGPQANKAEGSGLARRYQPGVAAFVGLPDEVTPEAWDDLAVLVRPREPAILFRPEVGPLPAGWTELLRLPGLQMVAPDPASGEGSPDTAPRSSDEPAIEPLGPPDVEAMLALVAATEPGPFDTRTIELGTYLGVRHRGRLVAMAGQRMRPRGGTEISAVCTDPDHRGQGLAGRLVRRLVEEIHGRGDVAFLHVATTNTTAVSRYRSLGFTVRRPVEAVAFTVSH